MEEVTQKIVQDIEKFCRERGLSYHKFGILAVNNNKIYARLKSGQGVSTRTIARLIAYMNE